MLNKSPQVTMTEESSAELIKQLSEGLSSVIVLARMKPLDEEKIVLPINAHTSGLDSTVYASVQEEVSRLYKRLVDDGENVTLVDVRRMLELLATALSDWCRNDDSTMPSADTVQITRINVHVNLLMSAAAAGKQLFDRLQGMRLLLKLQSVSAAMGAEQGLVSTRPAIMEEASSLARISELTDKIEETIIEILEQRIHQCLDSQCSSYIDLSFLNSELLPIHREDPYCYFYNASLQEKYYKLVTRADPPIPALPDILWYDIMRFMDVPTMLKTSLVAKLHFTVMKTVLADVLQDKFILPIKFDKSLDEKSPEERGDMLLTALKQRALKFKVVLDKEASLTASEKRWFWACFIGQAEKARLLAKCGDVNVDKTIIFSSMTLTGSIMAIQEGHVNVVRALLDGKVFDVNMADPEDGTTPLILASLEGYTEMVEVFLTKGAKVDQCQKSGGTALMAASLDGHTQTVACLLKHDANVKQSDDQLWTALTFASREGQTKTVQLLLAACADINHASNDGGTPLMAASEKGQTKTVQLLLQHRARVNQEKNDGGTALMLAILKDRTETMRLLLQYRAKVNQTLANGGTSLLIASRHGRTDALKVLLKYDVEINVNQALQDGWTSLMFASQSGHTEAVRLLLSNKAINVDQKDRRGWTALLPASQNGHLKIVTLLLAKGADVNQALADGATALILAAEAGFSEIVQLLLKNGTAVNHADNNGCTALMTAARNGHRDTVEELLEQCADVNQISANGATALMMASEYGHPDTVSLLLNKRANVDQAMADGTTSLIFASQAGHSKTVRMLLVGGAVVDYRDNNGCTALMTAARNGHRDTVELLLEQGAGVNLISANGATALMMASEYGHPDTVSLLLDKGANVDQAMADGTTALIFASQAGHTETVRMLLVGGAVVNQALLSGWAPLMLASEHGRIETAAELLKNDANANEVLQDGATALILASEHGNAKMVALLLANGAKVNQPLTDGTTALMQASQAGHIEAVRILLEQGALVNQTKVNGWTALMLASLNGHTEIVILLLKYGAAVNQINDYGWTSLMLASQHGHTETVTVALLQKKGINVNHEDKYGRSALYLAITESHEMLTNTLLSVQLNKNNVVLLFSAAYLGNLEEVKAYYKPEIIAYFGMTPMLMAVCGNQLSTLQWLLTHGALLTEVASTGDTPLMFAAMLGHEDLVDYLLVQGVDVNATSSTDNTALMCAIQYQGDDGLPIIELLVKAGASLTVKGDQGRRPLAWAAEAGAKKVMAYLISSGAQLDAEDMANLSTDAAACLFACQPSFFSSIINDESPTMRRRDIGAATAVVMPKGALAGLSIMAASQTNRLTRFCARVESFIEYYQTHFIMQRVDHRKISISLTNVDKTHYDTSLVPLQVVLQELRGYLEPELGGGVTYGIMNDQILISSVSSEKGDAIERFLKNAGCWFDNDLQSMPSEMVADKFSMRPSSS